MENDCQFETIQIPVIYHDEEVNRMFNKYPMEDGYDVEIIEQIHIDSKNEKITFKIIKNMDLNNIRGKHL